MTTAGVVYTSKFVSGGSKKFQKYVDYMDRNEAIRAVHVNEFNAIGFDGYNDYMGNPDKTSALFSASSNRLDSQQKRELKEQFIKAQENDSVMWQDVISFDDEWLIKNSVYDPLSDTLDEKRIMDSVRLSMNQILAREGMSHSAVWSGAIHYNTAHFHVHIAVVEPNPTREYSQFKNKKTGQEYTARRGYRSQTYLSEFRSKVANHLVNRDLTLGKINDLLRKNISNKEQLLEMLPDRNLKKQLDLIRAELPSDMRMWKYNMNALKDVRPLINEFVDLYIDIYKQKEMKELSQLLKEEAEFRKETYGEGNILEARWKNTESNKINELYASLGNTLLKELVNQEIDQQTNRFESENNQLSDNGIHSRAINALKRAFSKNLKEAKMNQEAFNEMQKQVEQEKEQLRNK